MTRTWRERTCECGATFKAGHRRAKLCPACRAEDRKAKGRDYMARQDAGRVFMLAFLRLLRDAVHEGRATEWLANVDMDATLDKLERNAFEPL